MAVGRVSTTVPGVIEGTHPGRNSYVWNVEPRWGPALTMGPVSRPQGRPNPPAGNG